jgi:hypothetical protein
LIPGFKDKYEAWVEKMKALGLIVSPQRYLLVYICSRRAKVMEALAEVVSCSYFAV